MGKKEVTPMPLKQGIPMVLIALLFVAGVSVILIKLDLCIWVVWLGMCAWAAMGMSMKPYDIVQAWLSGAFGLTLGYLLTSGTFGNIGLGIGAVCVLIFIFGMVTHRFSLLCNNYTALFLTCCTASGITLEPVQLAKSIVFGFCLFGLVPMAAQKVIAAKKQK